MYSQINKNTASSVSSKSLNSSAYGNSLATSDKLLYMK